MTQGPAPELQIFLCNEESAGRIAVEIDAFVRFSLEIDSSLSALEAKWHWLRPPTPPVARGPSKRSRNRQAS